MSGCVYFKFSLQKYIIVEKYMNQYCQILSIREIIPCVLFNVINLESYSNFRQKVCSRLVIKVQLVNRNQANFVLISLKNLMIGAYIS